MDHLVGAFALTNSCAIFDPSASPAVQFVALGGDRVQIVHGFSEYRFGFVRLATVRAPATADERMMLERTCDWYSQPAVAVPFTHNNVLHALYHSVPSFEQQQQQLPPPQQQQQPRFVPLLSRSAGIGRKTSVDPSSWHAWELAVRALTVEPASAVAAATSHILRAPCSCFRHLSGTTAPFAPASSTAATRLRSWARAALSNSLRLMPLASSSAGLVAAKCRGGILYVQRRRTRVIINERELLSSLRPTDHVHALSLEDFSISEQLCLIGHAVGLIGAHGQALAFAPFLAAAATVVGHSTRDGASIASIVEILPPPPLAAKGCGGRDCSRKLPLHHLYESLSSSLGIEHTQLIAALAPPCSYIAHSALRGRRVEAALLACNLTIAPQRFVSAVRRMRCQQAASSF